MGLQHGMPALILGHEAGGHNNQGSPSTVGGSITTSTPRSGSRCLQLGGTLRTYPLVDPNTGNLAAVASLSIFQGYRPTNTPAAEEVIGIPCGAPDFLPQFGVTAGAAIGICLTVGASFTWVWTGATTVTGGTQYAYTLSVLKLGNNHWAARLEFFDSGGSLLEDSGWQGQVHSLGQSSVNHICYLGSAASAPRIDDIFAVIGGVGAPNVNAIVAMPVPTGNGTETAWAATTANEWEAVDEVPPNDDTDYAHVTGAAGAQTYTHAATGLGAVTVLGLGLFYRMKRSGGVLAIGRGRLYLGSAKSVGGSIAAGTGAYNDGQAYESRAPNLNEWTVAGATDGVDNVELGQVLALGSGSPQLRNTYIHAEVAHGTPWTDDYDRQLVMQAA